jgi:hypothetical protein
MKYTQGFSLNRFCKLRSISCCYVEKDREYDRRQEILRSVGAEAVKCQYRAKRVDFGFTYVLAIQTQKKYQTPILALAAALNPLT